MEGYCSDVPSLVKSIKYFCAFKLVDIMGFSNNISLEKQETSYQLQNKKAQKVLLFLILTSEEN